MKKNKIIKFLSKIGLYNWIRDVQHSFNKSKKEEILFYKQFINPGDIVFDIGANIGLKTDVFLKCGAHVIAVEPQPDCYQYLMKKFKHNSQVTIINKGLSDKAGQGEIFMCESNALASMSKEWLGTVKSSGQFKDFNWNDSIHVELITFDQLIKQYGLPQFAKIDVEGFELNVIKGLSQPIQTISLEITKDSTETIQQCVHHINTFTKLKVNHSSWHTFQLNFQNWLEESDYLSELSDFSSNDFVGDIYIKSEGLN